MDNIAIITLESLRYDTALIADTPNFYEYFPKWYETYSHGTYTLPSHISLFHHGTPPFNNLTKDIPDIFKKSGYALFRVALEWDRDKNALFKVPEADNLVKGFEKLGYNTLGIGGVGWFNTNFQTSRSIWNRYFKNFYWYENFDEYHPNGFENQINFFRKIQHTEHYNTPLFFFINISSTHPPFRGQKGTASQKTIIDQVNALEYIDSHFNTLIDLLPKPLNVLMMSDHGTCIPSEDDGMINHGFGHPSVWKVPATFFKVN